MARFAVISFHTSPLAQPGTGDGGGMNVYVRELSASLARSGHEVDIYTRRDQAHQAATVVVEPGLRVHHVTAGPATSVDKGDLRLYVSDFTREVALLFRSHRPDIIHSHYWLSAIAGHELKHEFNVPHFVTFHTLERVKAETFEMESDSRGHEEEQIIGCADAVFASGDTEAQQIISHYGADPTRVVTVPLGVDHAIFSPGDRGQARCASHLGVRGPLILFVGRLQRLKGVDLALEAFITLRQRGHDAHLAIIGGPSGPTGADTLRLIHQRITDEKIEGKVLLPCFDAVRTGPTRKFCASNLESVGIDIHAPQTCERIEWRSSGCNQCVGSRQQKDPRAAGGITHREWRARCDRSTMSGKCTLY